MVEYQGFFLLIVLLAAIIFYSIAELFGSSKHIGRGWSFALLFSSFIFGIIAIIASPSAKKRPTKGNLTHNIFGWLFLIFGGLGLLSAFIGSSPESAITSPAFILLGLYLRQIYFGNVINENPKFYFSGLFNNYKKYNNTEEVNRVTKQKKEDFYRNDIELLRDLYERDVISKEEFYKKSKIVEERQYLDELHNSDIYKNLVRLKDNGILSDEEFEIKAKKLLENLKKEKNNS